MKRLGAALALAGVALLAVGLRPASAGPGPNLVIDGYMPASSPSWERPVAGNPPTAVRSDSAHYQAVLIGPAAGAPSQIGFYANFPEPAGTEVPQLCVYRPPFDPASPLTNVVACADATRLEHPDFTEYRTPNITLPLTQGECYVAVGSWPDPIEGQTYWTAYTDSASNQNQILERKEPADCQEQQPPSFSLSPTMGPPGTTVTLSSVTPCPALPAGYSEPSILIDSLQHRPVHGGVFGTIGDDVSDDGSWSLEHGIPAEGGSNEGDTFTFHNARCVGTLNGERSTYSEYGDAEQTFYVREEGKPNILFTYSEVEGDPGGQDRVGRTVQCSDGQASTEDVYVFSSLKMVSTGPGTSCSATYSPVEDTHPNAVIEMACSATGDAVCLDDTHVQFGEFGSASIAALITIEEDGTNPPPPPPTEGPLDASTQRLAPGEAVTVVGEGFLPGTDVDVELHSTPVHLGTAQVGSDGAFAAGVVIPANTAPGAHTLVATGTGSDGATRTLSAPITVTELPVVGDKVCPIPGGRTITVDPGVPCPKGTPLPVQDDIKTPTSRGSLPVVGAHSAVMVALGLLLISAGTWLRFVSRERPSAR